MSKGVIYYTNNILDRLDYERRLQSLVQDSIKASGLPIVSCSLKPMDFGENYVFEGESGAVTMVKQIILALEKQTTDYVFFCEHDVLYHPSHFDFTPPTDDTFYYNDHVWKCHLKSNKCITYTNMISLSGMCANRLLALDHFKARLKVIEENGFENGRNPRWARAMGYEPGKKRKNGGFTDKDKIDIWHSTGANIDIRHRLTMTDAKMTQDHFHHQPEDWVEATLDDMEDWKLKEMFFK